jgi:hypothetical protein
VIDETVGLCYKENMDNTYNRDDYTPEAKRERFLRVAERRTNAILETIRLLGNTSNKNLYQYTEADVDKIFTTIESGLQDSRTRFKSGKSREKFKLDRD